MPGALPACKESRLGGAFRKNAAQPADQPVRTRRVGGYGDDSGVETAKKRRDVFKARRIEQKHPLPREPEILEAAGNRADGAVEFAVSEPILRRWSVGLKRIRDSVGAPVRPRPQQVNIG